MQSILAIIPAWNEEASLAAAIADLRENAPAPLDILVVDDGSTDSTPRIAEENGAVVASLPFNLGIGAALRTGFQFAHFHGYQRAFQFDADGQHDAREVSKLMAGLDDGLDLVIGSRFIGDGEYVVGSTRGVAMTLLRWTIRALTGKRFTDTSSGFRGFSRPLIAHFARQYPREYMDSVEALVNASYNGFRVAEVPVRMRERVGGVPSNRNVKLMYHYIRLLSVLLFTFSRTARRREGST